MSKVTSQYSPTPIAQHRRAKMPQSLKNILSKFTGRNTANLKKVKRSRVKDILSKFASSLGRIKSFFVNRFQRSQSKPSTINESRLDELEGRIKHLEQQLTESSLPVAEASVVQQEFDQLETAVAFAEAVDSHESAKQPTAPPLPPHMESYREVQEDIDKSAQEVSGVLIPRTIQLLELSRQESESETRPASPTRAQAEQETLSHIRSDKRLFQRFTRAKAVPRYELRNHLRSRRSVQQASELRDGVEQVAERISDPKIERGMQHAQQVLQQSSGNTNIRATDQSRERIQADLDRLSQQLRLLQMFILMFQQFLDLLQNSISRSELAFNDQQKETAHRLAQTLSMQGQQLSEQALLSQQIQQVSVPQETA